MPYVKRRDREHSWMKHSECLLSAVWPSCFSRMLHQRPRIVGPPYTICIWSRGRVKEALCCWHAERPATPRLSPSPSICGDGKMRVLADGRITRRQACCWCWWRRRRWPLDHLVSLHVGLQVVYYWSHNTRVSKFAISWFRLTSYNSLNSTRSLQFNRLSCIVLLEHHTGIKVRVPPTTSISLKITFVSFILSRYMVLKQTKFYKKSSVVFPQVLPVSSCTQQRCRLDSRRTERNPWTGYELRY